MDLLLLKLLFTPLLITAVTLAGRRWGPDISGWLIGFPLTSGPVSLILALQGGTVFAAHAATATLAGQGATCAFCLAYSIAAYHTGWLASALIAVGTFFLSIFLINTLQLSLLPTFLITAAAVLVILRLIPRTRESLPDVAPPRWDLPMRMLLAASFVLALTSAAHFLGPQVSGLLSPFPSFGTTLAVFAHRNQGPAAVRKVVRGMVSGAMAFIVFFLVVGAALPHTGIAWTYLIATAATLGVNFLSLYLTRKRETALAFR